MDIARLDRALFRGPSASPRAKSAADSLGFAGQPEDGARDGVGVGGRQLAVDGEAQDPGRDPVRVGQPRGIGGGQAAVDRVLGGQRVEVLPGDDVVELQRLMDLVPRQAEAIGLDLDGEVGVVAPGGGRELLEAEPGDAPEPLLVASRNLRAPSDLVVDQREQLEPERGV